MSQPMKHIPSDTMVSSSFTLRRYTAADEAAAIELWRRTWQLAYPHINFNDRVDWWRQRWRDELVQSSRMRMRGLTSSVRAMAMRWRWPPDSVEPRSPTIVS